MLLVLTDSSSGIPTPSNGCCAGVANSGSGGVEIGMQLGGTSGTGTDTISVGTTPATSIYYVGNPGDFNGLSFNAGTWTIPLNVVSMSGGTVKLDSIYICQASAAGASKGTIGHVTYGLPLGLIGGVNSVNISCGASAVFAGGDVVIISYQLHATATASVTIGHDQTVTTPSTTGGSSGGGLPQLAYIVPSPFVYAPPEEERPAQFTRILAPNPVLVAGGVPEYRIIAGEQERHDGQYKETRAPYKAVVNVAGKLPQYRIKAEQPEERIERIVFRPSLPPSPQSSTPGVKILFKRGPLAHFPTLNNGEPCWAIDTHQLFVGDGFGNHFVGGMTAAPATSSSAGQPGMYGTDGTYLYLCIATNTWMRAALSSF